MMLSKNEYKDTIYIKFQTDKTTQYCTNICKGGQYKWESYFHNVRTMVISGRKKALSLGVFFNQQNLIVYSIFFVSYI